MMKPAVFMDRDGTIIEHVHYLREPDRVMLLPGAARAMRLMSEKGYLLFVVSNQSGVGRGLITESEFSAVHQVFADKLHAEGVVIAEFCYCFHRPEDECNCRKPKIGNLPRAFGQTPLDWARSFTVGDNDCDLRLADSLGGHAYLVLTGGGEATLKQLELEGRAGLYPSFPDLLAVAQHLPVY